MRKRNRIRNKIAEAANIAVFCGFEYLLTTYDKKKAVAIPYDVLANFKIGEFDSCMREQV